MNSEKAFFRIGRVRISVTTEKDSIDFIKNAIRCHIKGYICVSTLRTVVIANRIDEYQQVMENSLMNTPDGTPLVWCAHIWGLKNVSRACGPHLFPALLASKDISIKHFFLGDTSNVLNKLKRIVEEKYNADVVGMYSPPFAPLEEYDLKTIAKMIDESNANVVWTSLTAPKQDYLNALLLPYVKNDVILIGVGAAFRCEIGDIQAPDGFLQKIGLAGLVFRREGISFKKELVWYISHSIELLKYLIHIIQKKLRGKKYYEI